MMENLVKFQMSHLDRFAIIDEPCTVLVRVHNHLDWNNLYTKDGHNRWLITLKALTTRNFALIKEANKFGNLYYHDVQKKFLTGALWENQVLEPEQLPVKGEEVACVFNYVDNNLLCTNVNIIPRKRPKIYIHYSDVSNDLDELKDILMGTNKENGG